MPKAQFRPAPPFSPVTIIFVIILLLSAGLNLYFIRNEYEDYRVMTVPDGDSLQLADGRRIRLLGIDAPERDRCMADQAHDRLKELALNKHVRLEDTVTDDYGRTLANVFVADRLINAVLVE